MNSLNIDRKTILELENNLLLFNLNQKRSSGKIQKKNIKNLKKNKTNFINFSKEMLTLTKKMQKLLIKNKVNEFGKMIDYSWQIKKRLNSSTSNKFIDKLIKISKTNGAIGGKLLGAGETGYLLIYSHSNNHEKIIKSFMKYKIMKEEFSFNSNGLETWNANNE